MVALGPITAVEARIAALRQRTAVAGAVPAEESALLVDTTAQPDARLTGWDPFGAAYQQALIDKSTGVLPSSGSTWSAATGDVFSTDVARWVGGSITGIESYGGVNATPGSSVGRIGGFGPMPVPAELQMYGNGRIPAGVLQPIGQGGHVLYAPAAEAWQQAVQAAAADGIDLRITDSYRTYDQQVDLVERKGLYSQGGYGATPGTSNHGWGLAVDVDVTDPATLSWMRANGHRFGYVEAVPREPWHWEFRPTQA
ncbi:MAG: M15 family metallopeptidase [Ilumatobacteraceae bacterium]|nr:M15 family metallopeptidase [Acidimicrobiales bacterium]MCB9392782.1 D-alanyl-D-alanine carboxypeptidase family protein [Acidimicrobiaceae bacterium]